MPESKTIHTLLIDCAIAFVMDHVSLSSSYQLHASFDRASNFNLDESVLTAILMSLAGVGSIFMKQWHSCIDNTNLKAKNILRGDQFV